VKLYLGCGERRVEGYVHVDFRKTDAVDVVHDLNRLPWPWEDDVATRIVAVDVVEHLEIDLIRFCDECWRVMAPGGELFVRTPHHRSESSWIDPTHRWHIDERSFEYLDPETVWGAQYPHYTHRKWSLRSLGVRGPQNICAMLSASKPISSLSLPAAERQLSVGKL
jgi:hypothetical protein